MKLKILNRLSIRIIIAISVVLVGILAIHTYISITSLERTLTRIRFQNANDMSDLIKKSTRYSMLLDRRDDVHQIINTVGTEAGVQRIRIYNKQGEIIFSTDSTEINKKVNVTAEACVACHDGNGNHSLKKIDRKDKLRIFKDANDKRFLGLINPIENEKDCYTAECHAHENNVELLGVLDVVLSLDDLDRAISESAQSTLTNSILITVTIALVSGFFILILVNKPINKVVKGMEEVGKGNLTYKIDINSKDEIGNMALQFNEMSAKLDKAYTEIRDWSENLNKKVQEKSEELKNIYNQVVQIEKLASLGKLSATVAHELNNPLEGILTYSKLVSKKLKGQAQNGEHDKLINYLAIIADESARCGKIVKDLLLFSNKGTDDMIDDNLKPIVDKGISLIEHHLEMNNIELNKAYSADEIWIKCNPHKIQQALMALIINAIEAMPNGGTITISLERDKTTAHIRITDEGTGIPVKDLPHIFEPFYSTKDASKGTGLGLAVVYGIINSHNGKVVVENTSSSGTTFKISLPLIENLIEN